MSNLLTYTEIWAKALDEQAIQSATSGWMEENSKQVEYNGGKTVRMPITKTTGLGDYKKGTGAANIGKYPNGSVNISFQTLEMTQDRGAQFTFDRNDVDETGFVAQAPQIMAAFQREHVVPELDAYRYSKIYKEIKSKGLLKTAGLTKENVLSEFLNAVGEIQDKTGIDAQNLVATVSYKVYMILSQSAEFGKTLQKSGENDELTTTVNSINGVPIVPVMSAHMKTDYDFASGTSPTDLGFKASATAKDINFIICPRTLPIAVSKTDSLKVFTPEENQKADDWLIQYRKYHDLWLPENKLEQIIVSVTA